MSYLYVGCDCRGAVAQDGRIEPGDMILEVNGISFEDMTNDEAVQTLRSAAQRPGYVSSKWPSRSVSIWFTSSVTFDTLL